MGGRYFVAGTQLGILMAKSDEKILKDIESKQFMGNRGDDLMVIDGKTYIRKDIVDHTPKNKFKSKKTELLKILRASRTAKEKAGWSRLVGAGFVDEDIDSVEKVTKHLLKFKFRFGHTQNIRVNELNLRETEEAIKFLETVRCRVCGAVSSAGEEEHDCKRGQDI